MQSLLSALKWIVGILLVLVLIFGGLGVFLYPQIREMVDQARLGESGMKVRLETAERGRLVRTVSAPGTLEPRRKVSISARVAAQVESLPFREGDTVQAGEIVVRLDDRELKASLDSAEAQLRGDEARLEGAQATYVNAVAEWERLQSLFDSKDVSRSALDQAESDRRGQESNLNAARENIEVSRARVTQARENLRYATITSPISGRVTKLNTEEGEIAVTGTMNNPGTVIMEIADLSEMLVKASVSELDIARVEVGQTARVYINAFPDDIFEGTVRQIALQHTMDRDGSKYYETEILLHLSGDRTLRSGLSANVDIEIETVEGVIMAPSQAVIDIRVDELPSDIAASPEVDRDKTFARVIYKMVNGRAVATPVRIGSSDLTHTAILSGIDDTDEIVTGPWSALQRIKHNDAIRRQSDADKSDTAPADADATADSMASGENDEAAERPAASEETEASSGDDSDEEAAVAQSDTGTAS
ncbi:MAG: efflux RND transporter periplasmic adaptor subunit [Phycisphaeraceae bacterium]|nr:MAG: efflux RND transporter periplasmic adaptor subunit [Phycisphaeraceae bacterium]